MACFKLFELFYLMMGLCRFQRPPGPIPSSMLGLEALTGGLEDFGFEDYLNGKYIYGFVSNLQHLVSWWARSSPQFFSLFSTSSWGLSAYSILK